MCMCAELNPPALSENSSKMCVFRIPSWDGNLIIELSYSNEQDVVTWLFFDY